MCVITTNNVLLFWLFRSIYEYIPVAIVIAAVVVILDDVDIIVVETVLEDCVPIVSIDFVELIDLEAASHLSSIELLESSLELDFNFSFAIISLSLSIVDSVFSTLFIKVDSGFSSLTAILVFASDVKSNDFSSSFRSVSTNGVSGGSFVFSCSSKTEPGLLSEFKLSVGLYIMLSMWQRKQNKKKIIFVRR